MDILTRSDFVGHIIVVVATTVGIFLIIVLGGLLVGLIALGLLELFLRASIQKAALNEYFNISRRFEPIADLSDAASSDAASSDADSAKDRFMSFLREIP